VATREHSGRWALVVEDDAATRILLHRILEVEGFDVRAVDSAGEARTAVDSAPPDLVLLDLQLSDGDGLAFLELLVQDHPDVPCIIVSASDEEANRVLGLRLGADDYVVKPFSSGELLARVASVLRRSQRPAAPSMVRHGELCIDLISHEVSLAGQMVSFTAKEYALLHFLASSPRQVFTRDQLLRNVWGSDGGWQDTATVTEHVRRLRKKLDVDRDHPSVIETVRGVGYRFTG
jgi:two-component system, OmpR family, phosphate regulon response regulator PhoB